MVKCKFEYVGFRERELCEELGEMFSFLDMLFFVIVNDIVYWNWFCVFCNGVFESDI